MLIEQENGHIRGRVYGERIEAPLRGLHDTETETADFTEILLPENQKKMVSTFSYYKK
jgi:hypothetical protein